MITTAALERLAAEGIISQPSQQVSARWQPGASGHARAIP